MYFEIGDVVDTSRWNEHSGQHEQLPNPAKVIGVTVDFPACESGTMLKVEGSECEYDSNWFRPHPVYQEEKYPAYESQ